MRIRVLRAVTSALMLSTVLGGCMSLSKPSAMHDRACERSGVLFRSADYLDAPGGINTPRLGRSLGGVTKLNCSGNPTRMTREIYAMPGLDPDDVVVGGRKSGYALFVREPLREDLPALVAQARQFIPCRGPATFTATWDFIDPEDVPSFDDYLTAEVPYRAHLIARSGRGLPFDHWAEMRLIATITADTDPPPDDRVLEGALGPDPAPVQVRVRCRGENYEVASLRLAS